MTSLAPSCATQPNATPRLADVAVRMSRWLNLPAAWMFRVECRRTLAALDTRQLRDTGIDPDWVKAEIAKPFWVA